MALKKVALKISTTKRQRKLGNINSTRYKNRERAHGDKSGAFNVPFFYLFIYEI